ncbi:glutamine synthetase family protein [Pseudokordiimonas caeni]|uniref:glutamine synthetase family protein n=1 Tax=Pseudokordiimonas caeni TaxID=2997908 RepID=UPI0028127F76|nr:glutamine synthetase family protein [Pseudokordiimonas caeni]
MTMPKDAKLTLEQEVEAFLARHPDTEVIEVLLPDMNGLFRGKQLPIEALKKLPKEGTLFPITTPFLTFNGAAADTVSEEYGTDPDRVCMPVPGSLVRVPWTKHPTAQIMLTMMDAESGPFFMDPRSVLNRVLARYRAAGLTPVVALEFEFYLFEASSVPPVPMSPLNDFPKAEGGNIYNMDVLYDYEEILNEMEDVCKEQGLPITGIVTEYGSSQFEANLLHIEDPMRMCDYAMMLKRIIKGVAFKHGLLASFMAKPLVDEAGNGMHAHVSILDKDGNNIFDGKGGEDRLKHAVGGLLETMPEATALFAPNANSYRRFDPDFFAPVVPNWGENNRLLSVRLPMASGKDRRFEHRVCGADACPYLMLAAILAGAHFGLEHQLDPGPKRGEFDAVVFENVLPNRWRIALDRLMEAEVMKEYLGEDFVDLYVQVRGSEELAFHRAVSSADYRHYLRIV